MEFAAVPGINFASQSKKFLTKLLEAIYSYETNSTESAKIRISLAIYKVASFFFFAVVGGGGGGG